MTSFLRHAFLALKNSFRGAKIAALSARIKELEQTVTIQRKILQGQKADYVVTREGEAIKTTARVELRAKLPRR
jgi:DNA-binding HxlR family transcriptional regulator